MLLFDISILFSFLGGFISTIFLQGVASHYRSKGITFFYLKNLFLVIIPFMH